jgi:type I restriction enzyme S subunit
MKDSETKWLGKIPSAWDLSNIGVIYTLRNTKVSDKDYPPLSVTMKGIMPQLESAAKTNAHDDRKLVKKGDFVINSRSDRRGSCGIADQDGSVSLINTILCPNNDMNSRYYNWLFHTTEFADEFYANGHGIVDDLWTTGWQDMKRIIIPIPSLEVQKSIADFLDKKCSEIDGLMSDIQSQIDILEEYKKSIITEAVTKGLNPDVEMKDSGIEWIGMIPKHWDTPKVLYVLKESITDGPHTTPELFDDGIPFVSAEAVSCGNGKIDFEHIRGYISEEFYKECCKKYIPQINDIYMIKSGATTGRVAIVDTNRVFTIWSPLAVFRCNTNKVISKYMFYCLQSSYFQNQVQDGWSFGTQQNIGMRVLEQLKITQPPIKEQKEIVNHLDTKCAEADAVIADKKAQLETLAEYKKSLIYEYVTGKKEI